MTDDYIPCTSLLGLLKSCRYSSYGAEFSRFLTTYSTLVSLEFLSVKLHMFGNHVCVLTLLSHQEFEVMTTPIDTNELDHTRERIASLITNHVILKK